MIRSVKEYLALPKIKFPIDDIKALRTRCYECRRENVGVRAKVLRLKSCVELCGGSLCVRCRLVTPFVYRLYRDGSEYLNVAGRELDIRPAPKPSLVDRAVAAVVKMFRK